MIMKRSMVDLDLNENITSFSSTSTSLSAESEIINISKGIEEDENENSSPSSEKKKKLKKKEKKYYDVYDENDENPFNIKHKKPKKHIPFPGGDTAHGMMIDAGSQGTRLHIYEWNKRILLDKDDLLDVVHGQKLSFPTSNSKWTDKYTPGLDVFSDPHISMSKLVHRISKYLKPLIEFAKSVLVEKQDQWHTYPIYLKATGGLRTLPQQERIRVMAAVRKLFLNKAFNPFAFENEHARVISGEEEAIYGWVGVNFAMGTLIDKYGEQKFNPKFTYGMVEMGGASTQIAFFENNHDLMANLFKLELGSAKHWNVYVHSYLYSGINGAWHRLNAKLHGANTTINPCLPTGSEMEFSSWINMNEYGQFYPRSSKQSIPYSVTMKADEEFNFDQCSMYAQSLMRSETNAEWCDFEMDGDCGFAGVYQPPLPQMNKDIDEFIATSNFVDVYKFLKLGERAPIRDIGVHAQIVCGMEWGTLKEYNSIQLHNQIEDEKTLAQMCFRSIFVYHMLKNGWGFGEEYQLTAVDVINGQKLGWALGCMLYEINTLPWDFHPELLMRGPSWWVVTLYVIIGTLTGGAVGFTIAMWTSNKFNKAVRNSIFFKSHIGSNSFVRRSLRIPDDRLLDYLEEEDPIDGGDTSGEKKPLLSK